MQKTQDKKKGKEKDTLKTILEVGFLETTRVEVCCRRNGEKTDVIGFEARKTCLRGYVRGGW